MKILITGGSGFLGQSFIQKFTNYEYTLIDKNKSKIPVTKELNQLIEEISDIELFQLVEDSDVVIHLAAEKLHNNAQNTRLYESNITSTFRICNAILRSNKKIRLFFTSSLYAYGFDGHEHMKMTEDMGVKNFSLYGTSKYVSERLIKTLLGQKRNFNIVRLFFAYGPQQLSVSGYKSVIRKSLEHLQKNQPAQIYGSGSATLDYIYIDDVINFINGSINELYQYELVNLGSGKAYLIKDVIQKICEIYGNNSAFEYVDQDWTEGTYRVANVDILNTQIKYYCQYNLNMGLNKIIESL